MTPIRIFFLVLLLITPSIALSQSQAETPAYSRVNSFGVLAAYSNDSSHILLGVARQRKLLSFGASYSRRLLLSRKGVLQYDFEVSPVALESDPVEISTIVFTSPKSFTEHGTFVPVGACHSGTGTVTYTGGGQTYSYTYTETCSRQWTFGESMSPIGLQWNFRPRHKLQPLLESHGGYMFSTHPIPVVNAGSFNFTFDVGAGFELFRSQTRSIRTEYRYHHTSNKYTAAQNPGIDNGVLQFSYNFGR